MAQSSTQTPWVYTPEEGGCSHDALFVYICAAGIRRLSTVYLGHDTPRTWRWCQQMHDRCDSQSVTCCNWRLKHSCDFIHSLSFIHYTPLGYTWGGYKRTWERNCSRVLTPDVFYYQHNNRRQSASLSHLRTATNRRTDVKFFSSGFDAILILTYCRSGLGLVVSASDCGVRGPRFEYHRGRLCLWRWPLGYACPLFKKIPEFPYITV